MKKIYVLSLVACLGLLTNSTLVAEKINTKIESVAANWGEGFLCEPSIDNVITVDLTNCNSNDGSITIEASGGIGSFEYSIDNGQNWQTNNVFANLPVDDYWIQVRNSDGSCPAIWPGVVTLNSPDLPRFLTVTPTNPSNCGAMDGSIDIVVVDGNEPYQYSIDGAVTWSFNSVFTGLAAGTYQVWAMNGDGTCAIEYVLDVVLMEPVPPVLSQTTGTDPSNCGSMDGTISIIASGGMAPLKYSIDGGTTWSTNNTFSNLAGGNYPVLVSNADGTCETAPNQPVVLVEPQAPSFVNVQILNPNNCNVSNGSIEITANPGSGTVQYSINDGVTWQSNGNFNGLPAGTYQVAISNQNGSCSTPFNNEISLFEPPQATILGVNTLSTSNCGNSNGTIIISAIGGTGNLLYSIDNGQNWQSNNSFPNLLAGTYDVLVSNSDGTCPINTSQIITVEDPPSPIISNLNQINPSDCGLSNGSIEVSASSGTGSFLYSIDGGQNWQANPNFSNLGSGDYDVWISNSDGTCPISNNTLVSLNEPPTPTITQVIAAEPTECGLNNGNIAVYANGGTGTYLYSIDGGQNWQNVGAFTNLSGGTYNIAVSNSDGTCVVNSTEIITILEPSPPELITINSTNISNCNSNDGIIEIIATPGSNSIQFSADNGQTWQTNNTFTNLVPGTYQIIASNIDGSCTVNYETPITLTEPIAPSILTSVPINPSNCGAQDGSIIIFASGNGILEYSIDGGNTWTPNNNFSNLPSGNYNILVQNQDGTCESVSDNLTLSEPFPPTVNSVDVDDLSNCDAADGAIEINAVGGSGNLEYSIDDGTTWQSNNQYTNLPAGNYTIMVQNNDGTCTSTYPASVEVLSPTPPVIANVNSTNLTTCDGSNGTIAITADSGTGFLKYSIDGGVSWQPSPNFSNLPAGNYQIVVQNLDGTCNTPFAGILELTAPQAPIINQVIAEEASDCDQNDAFIQLDVSGGTGNFNYSIDGGLTWQASSLFSNIPSGDYEILVQNADGSCEVAYNSMIEIPDLVSPNLVSMNSQNPTDCGAEDGAITLIVGNSQANFQYSIDGGDTWSSSFIFSDLPAGNYDLVASVNGEKCMVDYANSVILTEPELPIVQSTEITNPTDCDATDGSILIEAVGGTGNYLYSVNGGNNWSSANLFTGLPAGTYHILVKPQFSNCPSTEALAINLQAPTSPEITSISQTDPIGCGMDDGQISILLNDSGEDFLFSIDGGQSWQNSPEFENLSAGNYQVLVSNSDGTCETSSVSATVLTAPQMPEIVSIDQSNPSDCGLNDGTIQVNAQAGNTTLEYSIDGGNTWVTESNFDSLSAGFYQVFVRNQDGSCSEIEFENQISLTGPNAPVISMVNSNDPTTCTSNDGFIDILIESEDEVEFSIDGGETWSYNGTFEDLSDGVYQILVQNSNGTCPVELNYSIALSEPPGPEILEVSTNQNSDCGIADGQLTIATENGIEGLQYSIDGGQSWALNGVFDSLPAGEYEILVQDTNSTCLSMYEELVLVSEPEFPILVGVEVNQPSECGGGDGSISISLDNESTEYEYSIDAGQSWQSSSNFEDLADGTFEIIVRNTGGSCETAFAEIVGLISVPELAIAEIGIQNPSNCESGDGSIEIILADENESLQFSIDGGQNWQTTALFENLSSSTYSVMVSYPDSSCQTTYTEPVSLSADSAPIIADVTTFNPTDCGATDGSILLEIDGVSDYILSLDGGDTWLEGGNLTDLPEDNYTILVANPDGTCETSWAEEISLAEPPSPVFQEVVIIEPSCGIADGQIEISATLSEGLIEYSIDGGDSWSQNSIFQNLEVGFYSIVIRLENEDCETTYQDQVELTSIEPALISDVASVPPSSCDIADGVIAVTAESDADLQYSIDGGQTWQEYQIFDNLSTGFYEILVSNANGNCPVQYEELVELEAENVFTITDIDFQNPSFCGAEDGLISIATEGNISNQQYSIDGGNSWTFNPIFSNLTAGEYDIVVSNQDGSCLVDLTNQVVLTEEAIPVITDLNFSHPTGCETEDGTISIVASNCQNCLYSIDAGETWQSEDVFTDLPEGVYTLSVATENEGCIAATQEFLILVQPQAPSINEVQVEQPSECGVEDGFIIIKMLGNDPDLLYSIDDGESWHTNNEFFDLLPGTYKVRVKKADESCEVFHPNVFKILPLSEPSIRGVTSTQITECDLQNGTIGIVASSLGNTVQYSIDGGSTWQNSGKFLNLGAGVYSLAVRNADGSCVVYYPLAVPINAPEPLSFEVGQALDPSCEGEDDGLIQLNVLTGSAPFNFEWSNGTNLSEIDNLIAGDYEVTVTDIFNCSATASITLVEPPAFTIELQNQEDLVLCLGQSATFELDDNPNISYIWGGNNGFISTESTVTINQEGNYWVTAVNENGCIVFEEVSITYTDEVLHSDFIMSTEGLINHPIIGIDITWPIPDEIEWVYDENTAIEIINNQEKLVLEFPDSGTYLVQMHAYYGECYEVTEKEITIFTDPEMLSNGNIQNANPTQVLNFNVSPNPTSGNFTAEVLLSESIPIQLYLFQDTGNLLEQRNLFNSSIYEESFNLNSSNPGIYTLVLQTPTEWRYLNVIKQ